VTLIGVAAPCD